MSEFPVSQSILSASHLGLFVTDRYGIYANCRLLKSFVNDTYLVTDDSHPYIFRVYSVGWRSEQEIAAEIQLISLLQENNIPVSFAIPDKTGNYIQALEAPEGKRFGVLFSFAPGEKKHSAPAETHYAIGIMMARMHLLTNGLAVERVHYTPQTMLIDSWEKFKSFVAPGSVDWEFMVSTQQRLLTEWQQVKTNEVRHGAVHLDIWADNLHVNEAGNITLFDFDFCGNGWLCLDIAFYLLMLYAAESDESIYTQQAIAFIKGYESITVISPEEKRLLPAMGASLYFFYLGVQREKFAHIFFHEEHVRRYIRFRLKKWVEFKQ